jgi:hypothetical protein
VTPAPHICDLVVTRTLVRVNSRVPYIPPAVGAVTVVSKLEREYGTHGELVLVQVWSVPREHRE